MINALAILLATKLLFTIVVVLSPFLFLPVKRLNELTGSRGETPLTYRLYGVAILALCAGYSVALLQAWSGVFPSAMVLAGLVSNLGAALVLASFNCHPTLTRLTPVFAIIGAGLALALLFPAYALAPFG